MKSNWVLWVLFAATSLAHAGVKDELERECMQRTSNGIEAAKAPDSFGRGARKFASHEEFLAERIRLCENGAKKWQEYLSKLQTVEAEAAKVEHDRLEKQQMAQRLAAEKANQERTEKARLATEASASSVRNLRDEYERGRAALTSCLDSKGMGIAKLPNQIYGTFDPVRSKQENSDIYTAKAVLEIRARKNPNDKLDSALIKSCVVSANFQYLRMSITSMYYQSLMRDDGSRLTLEHDVKVSNKSTVNPAPTVSVLNPIWHGKWVGRGGEAVQITPDRVAGCAWMNSAAEFPKRKGCWAYYGNSQSGAQLVGLDGKAKLNPESIKVAKSIVATDKYKTVLIQHTDERGKVENFGDCSTFYFHDKQRVIRGTSCQRDSGFETDLSVFVKAG